MKVPKRRSLPASIRMVITSGVAATGWLLLGATGAHAAEEPALLPDPPSTATITTDLTPITGILDNISSATPIAPNVVPARTTVTDAAQVVTEDLASVVTGPVGTVGTVTTPVTSTVDDLVDATPVVGEVVPGGAATTLTDTPLGAVQDPVAAMKDPIATVETLTTPVTGAVDDVLGATPVVEEIVSPGTVTTVTDAALGGLRDPVSVIIDPVGTVETITTPVTEVLSPVTGTVEDILGPAPVTGGIVPPALENPGLTPVVPALAPPALVAPVTTIAPDLSSPPSLEPTPAATSSPHSAPAPARPGIFTGTATDPASADISTTISRPGIDHAVVAGSALGTVLPPSPRAPSVSTAGPGQSSAPVLRTGPVGAVPGPTAPASTGGTAAPTGNGGASGGGSGSPLGSADPAGWPGMPGGTCYLQLFPRLHAGEEKSFFEPVENPPTAPVFDPGSTPD